MAIKETANHLQSRNSSLSMCIDIWPCRVKDSRYTTYADVQKPNISSQWLFVDDVVHRANADWLKIGPEQLRENHWS